MGKKRSRLMANSLRARVAGIVQKLMILATLGAAAAGGWELIVAKEFGRAAGQQVEVPYRHRSSEDLFALAGAQWTTLGIESVGQRVFRYEQVTEGKIAVDEDRATQVFSPYSGRLIRLLAKPGDDVTRGQLLFTVEATDMVQALNDFIAGVAGRNKAQSQLSFAEIDERRYRTLAKDKAIPQRDFEQTQTALTAAKNDLRSAETALEAVRNRLRILGKTDEEIAAFEQTGKISPETPIYSPIGGTVVQRKGGVGQFQNTAVGGDPVYVISDLSTVWLVAYVRETEASKIRIGQQISFTLLSRPGEVYHGNIQYVATTLDASSRRLMIRTSIHNEDGALKPEMYANVTIFTEEGDSWPAIPRAAVIYEGDTARVWVAHDDKTVERRTITPGLIDGGMIQVTRGLQPGEKVVTKGSLFIDRAAAGG
jgi:cobalt-zinc-cadmium efflux system membrane fusion protein